MTTIGNIAKHIRTKNAGPFWVTIDIFCSDNEKYELLKNSRAGKKETYEKVYSVDKNDIQLYFLPNLNVIKVSFPRPQIQGNKYEYDMHFGQQYVDLLNIEL